MQTTRVCLQDISFNLIQSSLIVFSPRQSLGLTRQKEIKTSIWTVLVNIIASTEMDFCRCRLGKCHDGVVESMRTYDERVPGRLCRLV